MTPSADAARLSPWVSAWSSPRQTIGWLLAKNPRQHVLVLAALAGIAQIAVQGVDLLDLSSALLDWRVIAAIVLLGAAAGVAGVYLNALFLKFSARLFGGRGSMVAIRAALAWGALPFAIGLPVCLVIVAGLASAGVFPRQQLVTALHVVTAVLGLWTLVCVLLMFARVESFGFWRTIVSFVLGGVVFTLILPLLIRTFLFQPFDMPSGSMLPTLLVGDHFFVSKYSYGYTHYSLPLSPPLFSGRLFASEPQRGDIAVFRLPKDDSIDYVKRIVGLPGDRVQMIGGVLQINGQPVKHERIDDFVASIDGAAKPIKRYRETLPNGVSYTTIALVDHGFYDDTPLFTVPAGHYFMIGDNLDNSTDSRVMSQVGYVPFENLVGRAAIIYFSVDRSNRTQPSVRFDRIGMAVR